MDTVLPLIGIDIGGTWTRVALVHDRTIVREVRHPTPKHTDAFLAALFAVIADLRAERTDVAAVGVSVTGPVSPFTGTLFAPPNNSGPLAGLDLGDRLRAETGLPVAVDRDTNCALIAEAAIGGAAGHANAIFATFSTGVGASVLLNGALLRGRDGTAGELGHMVQSFDGPLCGCGRRGCVEAFASGTAIAAASGFPDGAAAAHAAEAGDPKAQAAFALARESMASACADWVNAFNPEVIVIGGSVAQHNPEWVEHAQARVSDAFAPARDNVPVVLSTLGDHVSLLGAAILAESALS